MARTIGIVSAKGGVGKTVITTNLAAASMDLKKKVIALDADVKMSGLGLQLGMYHFPVTLNDVLRNTANLLDAMYVHPTGLRIIPASLYVEEVSTTKLDAVTKDHMLGDNLLLIDAPPGLEKNALNVLKACQETLIVSLPEIPSVIEAMKTVDAAKKFKTKPIGIVLNRCRKKDHNQVRVGEVEAACNLPVIATTPDHSLIQKSIFYRTPAVFLDPYAPPSRAFKRLACEILDERYRAPSHVWLRRVGRRFKR